MKVHELLSEYKKNKSLKGIIKYRRPKYKFTEFIIDGYLSFFSYRINEAFYTAKKGKLYTGKNGKKFNTNVTYMKNDLNYKIKLIDNYCKIFPKNVMGYNFPEVKSGEQFVREFKKFIDYVNREYKREKTNLKSIIDEKSLSQYFIDDYNNFNKGISAFNDVLVKINEMFTIQTKNKDDVDHLLFNDTNSVKSVIEATDFELVLLEVPNKPIFEADIDGLDLDINMEE